MAKQTIDSGGKSLRAGLRAAGKLGKQLAGHREAGFGIAQSASAAGQANLVKQLGRYGRVLSTTQTQVKGQLANLVGRSKANERSIPRARARITGELGTAMSGYAGTVLRPAEVQTREATRKSRALQGVGQAGARVAGMAMGIAAEGAAAQGAAAEYMLASALQQRTIIDNQTLAQLTGQMYQSAIDYNMQWQMRKKELDYMKKEAEKAEEVDPNEAAELAEVAPKLAADAFDAFRAARELAEENPGEDGEIIPVQVQVVREAYLDEYGYAENSPQDLIFTATLQGIKRGESPSLAATNAIQSLYGSKKGFDTWGQGLLNSVAPGFVLEYSARDPSGWGGAGDSDPSALAGTLSGAGAGALAGAPLGPPGMLIGAGVGAIAGGSIQEQINVNRILGKLQKAKTKKEVESLMLELKAAGG